MPSALERAAEFFRSSPIALPQAGVYGVPHTSSDIHTHLDFPNASQK